MAEFRAIELEKPVRVLKSPSPQPSVGDDEEDPEHITWGHWELRRDQIEILKKIGEGEFGEVSEGKLHGTGENEGMVAMVAIKQLKMGSASKAEFLREAHFMVQLHHRNLVNIYGVLTKEEPVLIVSELCVLGALKTYLLRNRFAGSDITSKICFEMIKEICYGMEFVSSERFIHRDLAARNVLVERKVDSIRCKIADLGLAVRCFDDFHQGDVTQPVPIRWSAPEAIRRGHFSERSDVWSFGITMYEIVTFGSDPYDGVTNREVVQMVCDQGMRLPCPTTSAPRGCPKACHDIMVKCWDKQTEARPSFCELVKEFEEMEG